MVWALKPWTSALSVAIEGWGLDKMYALSERPYAEKEGSKELYACTCADRKRQAMVTWRPDRSVAYVCDDRPGEAKTCKDIQEFIMNQKHAKVAKVAVCSSVVGIPFYAAYAGIRSLYKRATGTIHADRTFHAKSLIRSALPTFKVRQTGDRQAVLEKEENGCRQAQALIALMVGDLNLKSPSSTFASYSKTMNAMVHPEGWQIIFKGMSASIIWLGSVKV